ncbi:MAG: CPBP family intramembrane metalloprotease [Spirochaetales bacterium]|nr:CPBP family intramembrane metalloprotease [Spirochaetales bacterium]
MNKKITLDGSFEAADKNPLSAAFIIICICGGIYFLVPAFIFNVYIVIDALSNSRIDTFADKDYFEILAQYYNSIKIPVLIVTGAAQYSILFGLSYFLVKKWHTKQIAEYAFYLRFSLPGLVIGIASAFVIIPVVEFISYWSYLLFPILEKMQKATAGLFTAYNPWEMILLLFVIGVTPAFCEEFLFRGYFQRTLQRKLKTPWHFIISGAIFALFHFQLLSLPALVVIGIYLGFLYYVFGSIYVTMAAHLLYNSTLIILCNFEPGEGLFFTATGYFQLPIVGLAFMGFTALIIYSLHYLHKNKSVQKAV